MFMKFKLALAATAAIIAAPLAGVGLLAAEAAPHGHEGKAGHHRMGGMGMFGQGLNLTEAQQAQMKAIAKKYRGDRKPGQAKGQRQEQRAQLRSLLLADQVDGQALRRFLEARATERASRRPDRTAMMAEMRQVLTPEQRAQLVTRLKANRGQQGDWQAKAAERHDRMKAKLQSELKLTPAQQQAFSALEAKLKAAHQSRPAQARRQALANFIETGDQAAFRAATQGQRAQLPVNELVAVAESLDQAQRQKLVAKFEHFAQLGGERRGKGKEHKGHQH